MAISSLDDAVDLVSLRISQPLLALYVFGDPMPTKYLAQFIRNDASFVNHIPSNLLGACCRDSVFRLVFTLISSLVGPAAPLGYPVSPVARYRREMLEFPSPQFVHSTPGSIDVQALANSDSTAADRLLAASLRPLKPMGQPRAGDMNFFVQGLKASFALYIYLPLTIAAGGILGYGARSAYRYLR